MFNTKLFIYCSVTLAAAASLLTGCQSVKNEPAAITAPATAPVSATVLTSAPATAMAPTSAPVSAAVTLQPPVRIKAGLNAAYTDAQGQTWLPDQGFDGGDVVERDADLKIENTTDAAFYRSEHFSMNSFSCAVPNGKYAVKLHFAETFEEITEPGQRVFSFNVNGQDFKDFDVLVKAGGPRRAYVQTVNVDITNGKLNITFTPNVENPEINGIEILPAS